VQLRAPQLLREGDGMAHFVERLGDPLEATEYPASPVLRTIIAAVELVLGGLRRLATHVQRAEERSRAAEARLKDVNRLADLWLVGRSANGREWTFQTDGLDERTGAVAQSAILAARVLMTAELAAVLGHNVPDFMSDENVAAAQNRYKRAQEELPAG
jgi:hypothetical protein